MYVVYCSFQEGGALPVAPSAIAIDDHAHLADGSKVPYEVPRALERRSYQASLHRQGASVMCRLSRTHCARVSVPIPCIQLSYNRLSGKGFIIHAVSKPQTHPQCAHAARGWCALRFLGGA